MHQGGGEAEHWRRGARWLSKADSAAQFFAPARPFACSFHVSRDRQFKRRGADGGDSGRMSAEEVQSLVSGELLAQRAGVQAELASATPERRVTAARDRVRRSAAQLAAALAQIDAFDGTVRAAEGPAAAAPDTHSSPQPGGDRHASTGAASAGCSAGPDGDEPPVSAGSLSRSAASVHLESLRALSTAVREPLRAALRLLEERLPAGVGSARSQLSDASLDRVGTSDAALDECVSSLEAINVSATAVAGAAAAEADALDSCSADLGRAAQLVLQFLDDDARRIGAGMEDVASRLASQLLLLQAQEESSSSRLFLSRDDHAAAPADLAAE